MRVKKRVKRGVKKGIKRVKSAPPEAYVTGMGVLVGGAVVVLLATTKSGRELLIRSGLRPEPDADEPESQESEVQEEVHRKPGEDSDVEESEFTDGGEKPEADSNGHEESDVTDLKPRIQRPRSPRKPPAPRKAADA